MNRFPFPDRENSMQELLSDYVFPKIEKDKIQEMFDTAWSIGEQAADAFIGQWGQENRVSMREVLQRSGVKIIEKDIDYVVGKRRYFCEFFSGTNVLKIYKKQATRPETCHLQNQQIHGPVGPGAALNWHSESIQQRYFYYSY